VALKDPGEVSPLLGLGAVAAERANHAEAPFDDDPSRDATSARNLFDDEHDAEDRPAGAAVLARDRHAHEATRDEILHVVPGILLALVPARRPPGERSVGQVTGALAQ